jgi:hypothetical protein
MSLAVEIQVSAAELGEKLTAMRSWLDHSKCSLMIDARLDAAGIFLVRVELDSAALAHAFRLAFDPGLAAT